MVRLRISKVPYAMINQAHSKRKAFFNDKNDLYPIRNSSLPEHMPDGSFSISKELSYLNDPHLVTLIEVSFQRSYLVIAMFGCKPGK
jgi:hypothetical protein